MPNENEFIAAVLAGDPEAFADLVRAHQARVRLACLVWLGNSAEADDAAQDVFVKAFKALNSFKGEASFLTWILRIADNQCRDILRTRTRRRTESLDALLAQKGEVFESLLSRADGVQAPLAPSELEFLGRLFAALPDDDREILALREVEELSYDAIAQRLRCSLDAVKGRLKRARQNLTEKCRNFIDTSKPTPRL